MGVYGTPKAPQPSHRIPGAAGKHQVTPANSAAADGSQGNGIQMCQHLGRTATWGMGWGGWLIPLFEIDTDGAPTPPSPPQPIEAERNPSSTYPTPLQYTVCILNKAGGNGCEGWGIDSEGKLSTASLHVKGCVAHERGRRRC